MASSSASSWAWCVLQLVEAKLKRAYQEGQAARLAGQDPLAAELAALVPRAKTHAAGPALPTGPEDDDHTFADPTPPLQSPPRAAVGVSQQHSDAGRVVGGGLSREEQLRMAQADANMAALLQEEAGSAPSTLRLALLHGSLCHIAFLAAI